MNSKISDRKKIYRADDCAVSMTYKRGGCKEDAVANGAIGAGDATKGAYLSVVAM